MKKPKAAARGAAGGGNVNAQLVSTPNLADFAGHYRKPVKTSIARTAAGRIAPTKAWANLGALLGSLLPDQQMRANYKLKPRTIAQKQRPGKGPVGPQTRFAEEIANVTVPCWICAVKYETSKDGDNDFHVIVTDSANPGAAGAKFMTSEVSGLPAGGDRAVLQKVRQQLVDLFPAQKLESKFFQPKAPIKVRLSGSLHFDGDHFAGKIGPANRRPQTVWEIHPVTLIEKG